MGYGASGQTKAKPLRLTPGGFAVFDVHDIRNSSGSFATLAAILRASSG
jgi:hypothetical protein